MHNIRLKSGALKTRFRVRDLQDKSGNKPADEACQLIQGFTGFLLSVGCIDIFVHIYLQLMFLVV